MNAIINTIVVGTDGSPQAAQAVRTAGQVAAAVGAGPVHIVSACRRVTPAARDRALAEVPREFWDTLDLHEDTWRALGDAQRILEGFGLEAEVHLIEDRPTDAIIDVAEREHADLIVIGSHGYGPAGRALHRSVSSRLVHRAPCAVLVAGEG